MPFSVSTYSKERPIEQATNEIRHILGIIENAGQNYEKQITNADKKIGTVIQLKTNELENIVYNTKYSLENEIKKSFQKEEWFTNIVKAALTKNDELFKIGEETHDKNLPIIENNGIIISSIKSFMGLIGMPQQRTEYYYKSQRSMKQESRTVQAGYLSDIAQHISTQDNFDSFKSRYEKNKKELHDLEQQYIRTFKNNQEAKERESKKKNLEKSKSVLIVKYELDYESDWHDILDAIIGKNKYLYLAHYLEKNRGDWTEGYSYAETGLSKFTIDNGVNSDVDKKIYDDIQYHISNWDGDGRVFRDCEYNYGVIYELVDDENLMKDYALVKENISDY